MIKKYLCLLLALMSFFSSAHNNSEEQVIAQVLDNFHQAAGKSQADDYFNLLDDNAIFLGTDANERWTKAQFKGFALPHFSQGNGWLYVPIQRHITIMTSHNMAFFDELLDNKKYGVSRGSGVLIKGKYGWKIAQYNLSIPLPNDLAADITSQIKAHREP